jgi:hypothetical protein
MGTVVRDAATDRVGILRDVLDLGDPYGVHPKDATGLLAFLAPVGGGIEWDTEPENLRPVDSGKVLNTGVVGTDARSGEVRSWR